MSRLIFVSLTALALVACSTNAGSFDADTGPPAAPEDHSETGAPPGEDDADEDSTRPDWWSLTGAIEVADGAMAPEQTALHVQLWGASAGELSAQCEAPLALLDAPPLALPDGETTLFAWWELTLSPPAEGACDLSRLTQGASTLSFRLGMGANDPRLAPAATANGVDFDASTSAAYGAYLQRGADGPLWVFGIASSEAQRNEASAGQPPSPVPDGVYDVRTLHLLPLP